MAGIALNGVQIKVNGQVIDYEPSTFEYDEGFGERMQRIKTAGGQTRTTVATENLATKFGSVKFTLLSEDISADLVRSWLARINNNLIECTQPGSRWGRTFTNSLITNNPKVQASHDGKIEVEFQTDPPTAVSAAPQAIPIAA